jgi:hypothetical protein
LWQTAASIPGVEVAADQGGAMAARFGATTSGQAVLFSPAGDQLFSGGITGARGHQGENRGRNSVVAMVLGRPADTNQTPVFGCSLVEPDQAEEAR